MSHLKAKIKRPVLEESCIMGYLDLCIQLFFFPKDNVKSLSGQNFKKINIRNIKTKPPVEGELFASHLSLATSY